MRRKISALTLAFFSLIFSQPALAFELTEKIGREARLSKPSEFLFQSYKNQELISIRLLGAVAKPGLYHVPKDLSLVTLLTLAGGTTKTADIEKIRIGNDSKNERPKSLTLNLNHAFKAENNTNYILSKNDIVFVDNKTPWISNDTFRIVSVLSVLLSGVLTALVIEDRLD